ncbi:hypothetical protein [Catelliglobosispora koreensis]|uniref:hypothetical protein n=1 Tax=Catelliglobosispora koreensis TaxID=129052 RepID=UPI000375A221|nr:hypothetical protein [Catelliglobosispora koreensis]
MTDLDESTFEAEILEEDAARDIAKAVSARHSIARKYVMRVRRKHPDATPAEVIRLLERHYVVAISTAGAVIAVGVIAAEVGISMIPGSGAVKTVGQKAGAEAVKAAAKTAAKNAALGVAKTGAQRAVTLLPAGDKQLQFEITAIFGLAIADIHSMNLDKEQAQALVYGLSNTRVSQQQIATMATDIASTSTEVAVGGGQAVAVGRGDWSQWANTLASMLPGDAAQTLVRTIQTGKLDTVRPHLSGKQPAAVDYGVGALAGGVTRFVFGREVVDAARVAFADPPGSFPSHLAIPVKAQPDDDADAEPNRAFKALEDAAKATANWVSGAANAVGSGVATAAGAVSRPFRSVDRDGDGVPDAPQALTAVKGVGGAIAGAAGAVGGAAASLFKSKKPTE